MLGYIISDKEKINVEEHEIKSFDILHKTNLNIFVIKNNKVLYKNQIITNACCFGHVEILEWLKISGYDFDYNKYTFKYYLFEMMKENYKFKYDELAINYASENGHGQVLEWFKNSGYEFKYDKCAIIYASSNKHYKILEFFKNLNVKKVIKWSKPLKFNKTIKYKTKNNYIKGYNKN